MKTKVHPMASPLSYGIHDPAGLRAGIKGRLDIISKIQTLSADKRSLEIDIIQAMIDQGLVDCLTINWSRLNRSVGESPQ